MNTNYSDYISPLSLRYASNEMKYLFSSQKKFSTFRKLWVYLAEAEKELGLNITDEQINEMKENIENIDFDKANEYESTLHHDVMAHVKTFADCCKKASPIIHLGATSCYVGDNTDILVMVEALKLIKSRLVSVIEKLCDFCEKYKSLPTLGFTHFQSAQPTTVGKRGALWLYDLLLDLDELEFRQKSLKILGCRGTTGTSASFLELFDGDESKVKKLEKMIEEKCNLESVKVSGQTYTRKLDSLVQKTLSSICESASKFACDMRLLCHLKEVEEPFSKNQIGSSAMAYKRNPMLSERICALSRYVIVNSQNGGLTHSVQWLERSLDDSANRRLAISEAFLTTEAVLLIYDKIVEGIVVNEKVITRHLEEELPFMATENILMNETKKGKDRQKMHELIRLHSVQSGLRIKEGDGINDLIDRIVEDDEFSVDKDELLAIMKPENYIGLASEQTKDLVNEAREKLKNLD